MIIIIYLISTVLQVDYNLYSLPVSLGIDKLKLSQRGRSVVIKTDFGLTVQYDWNSYVLVTLSSNFAGKVCGLCGNFNRNPNDDFETPSGSQAANAVDFGRSWKVCTFYSRLFVFFFVPIA